MRFKMTKKRFYAWCIVIIINLLIFQSISNIEVLSYLDETLTLIFLAILIYNKKKITGINYYILLILMLFFLLGGLSTVLSENVVSYKAALIDAFRFLKWPLTFIVISSYCDEKLKKEVVAVMCKVGKIMLIVTCVFGIINFTHDIGMSFDVRNGIRTYKFIFNNPAALNETNLVYYCFIARKSSNRQKRFYFGLFALCTLFTLRGNGLGVLAIYVLLTLLLKFEKKLRWWHFVVPALVAIAVAWEQVQMYLLQTSVRSIMYINGWSLAKNKFPLGEGFATFGSDQAYKVYSPIYQRLGFNMLTFSDYRNDNFWAMIMGQFGFVSLLVYGILLILVFSSILKSDQTKNVKKLMAICWTEMFISSIGNAIYTSVGSMIIFGAIAFMNYKDSDGSKGIKEVTKI